MGKADCQFPRQARGVLHYAFQSLEASLKSWLPEGEKKDEIIRRLVILWAECLSLVKDGHQEECSMEIR